MQWLKLKNILPKRVILKITVFFLQLFLFSFASWVHILCPWAWTCLKAFTLETTKIITVRLLESSISSKLWSIFWLPSEQRLLTICLWLFSPLPPMVALTVFQIQILSSRTPEYISKLLMFLPLCYLFVSCHHHFLPQLQEMPSEKISPHPYLYFCHYLQNSQNHWLLIKSMILSFFHLVPFRVFRLH